MAKKDYPGLVIVPPSDRTILRRRAVRWSLFLIPAIWIASTVMVWPPTSNDDTACQGTADEENDRNPPEECGRSNQVTALEQTSDDKFNLTQISQAEGLTESQHSTPLPTPENYRLPPAPMTHENPTTEPSDPADRPADHTGAGSNSEKSAVSAPAKKSSPIPTSDARLAEQGDAFAQYRLGKYYAKQNGRQAPESVSWYKKASTGLRRLAEAGNGQAMYVLGVMYAYGRGVARNTEEARRWLTQAVQHNVTAAQPVLAGLEAKQAADPKQKGGGPVQNATPQKSLKRDR